MRSKKKKKSEGLVKSIVLAHVVLILHLGLFAALGLLVAFLGGIVQYMTWVLMGGMAVVALSAYLFYRRLRRQGKSIREALRSPEFSGRAVEISLLGGMATLRLDRPAADNTLPGATSQDILQLEDPEVVRISRVNDLAELLQKELITPEEFARAKERLLGP